ncbi:MAG: right-handed parallel beta-helix repeat-containing protein [Gemmatimonadota bacterium]|nr:right-handed parallel beta-helix repeat-containing protein [Gemmatimonadota bacterium]MDP6802979.1 right-handed parallel beta-helix repeat-containing protein [Gemmatimonadota bacterium]MDP7032617.1 right-handed parallel beta-helix repeat-containing protein [Gemmatimonadota bacterium]
MKWMPRMVLPTALLLVVAQTAPGAVRRVPDDHTTIAAALTASASGDSVLVAEGTYAEHLNLVDGVVLLGGWDPGFTTQDPSVHTTNVHGGGTGSPFTADATIGAATLVSGFLITGGGGFPGAGVVIDGGSPTIRGNDIYANGSPGIAGGVLIRSGSTARIEGNLIRINTSTSSGGGLRVESSSPSIVGNTIRGNVATDAGGGIYFFASSAICSTNVFLNNSSTDGGGGGVYFQNCPDGITVADCLFEGNTSTYGGAALLRDESTVSFSDTHFELNTAISNGGAICALSFTTLSLDRCTFANCTAGSYGGGVYARFAEVSFTGTDPLAALPDAGMSGCHAGTEGGGIFFSDCEGEISRSAFSECTAVSRGGGIGLFRSAVTILGTLVAECVSEDGGGIAVTSDRANNSPVTLIQQCTIYGCSATGSPSNKHGGGVVHIANNGEKAAELIATIVCHTRQGTAIRCKKWSGSGAGKPSFSYTIFHQDSSNPETTAVGGNQCLSALSGPQNHDGDDPLLCGLPSPVDFSLQDCSPAVIAGSTDPTGEWPFMGVAKTTCACETVQSSLESISWGRVKSLYR